MISLMTVIRQCYWAWIFIYKHKENNIFYYIYTYRICFDFFRREAQVRRFSVRCKMKRNEDQEF